LVRTIIVTAKCFRQVRVLNRLKQERGAPKMLFCDNGSEFTGQMMDLWLIETE
jgi:hypothetical protein